MADRYADARRLVTQEGASYAEAAEATGIPLSTLQKRGAAEGWLEKRDVSRSMEASREALRAAILDRTLALAQDPQSKPNEVAQLVHAWRGLEAVSKGVSVLDDPAEREKVALEVIMALVEYLGEKNPTALAPLQGEIRGFLKVFRERV